METGKANKIETKNFDITHPEQYHLSVEIGLLIRSPDEHGSTPIAQTWNVGNRPISTNDNYIRDAYSISALVRNKYYE